MCFTQFRKGFGIEYENSLERSRKYTKYDQHIKFYKSQTGQVFYIYYLISINLGL